MSQLDILLILWQLWPSIQATYSFPSQKGFSTTILYNPNGCQFFAFHTRIRNRLDETSGPSSCKTKKLPMLSQAREDNKIFKAN
ncbi:hypothetical protein EVA_04154 [gut metagenome]|uniref:Uncharacterized protein n=1 Tax=gut metagenome TaxID=749906 RepID=J9GXC7_9ZZZZ